MQAEDLLINPSTLQAGNLLGPGHLLLTQLISTTTMCEQVISKLTHLCNSRAAPVPPVWDPCSACAPSLGNTNGSRDVTLRPRCTVPEVTGLTAPICRGHAATCGQCPLQYPLQCQPCWDPPTGIQRMAETSKGLQRDLKGNSKSHCGDSAALVPQHVVSPPKFLKAVI